MINFQQNITDPLVILGCYTQRGSCSFGVNSEPSQVELDLISPSPVGPYDESVGASGWLGSRALPGSLLRVTFGAFDSVGIITAWTYNSSSRGNVYNVKMSDPRIMFDQYQISLDGSAVTTGVYIPNFANIFNYYDTPQSADLNSQGITFAKVRDFLIATGRMVAWGNPFKFEFSSGFLDSSTGNPSGIPSWYRIGDGVQSLSNILQRVSTDMNLDYYAYVKTDAYDPAGLNTIRIQDIPRRATDGSDAVSGFITNARASGVLIDHQYGQELRLEPNGTVLAGPPKEYWPTINTSDVEPIWGVTDKGTLVTTPLTALSGIVLLDHIAEISGLPVITNTVTVGEITFIKSTGASYPPQVDRVFYNRDLPGYQVSENILRASLYSKAAWEAMLYYDNTDFAVQIGITGSPFLTPTAFDNLLANQFWYAKKIGGKVLTNYKLRSATQGGILFDEFSWSALQDEVYQATKRTAETYYGRQWLVRCGSSQWLASGTYTGTDLKSMIEFEPVQYGWSNPNNTQSSGVLLNWPNVQGASSSTFKDDVGRTTAFLGVPNSRISVNGTNFPNPVDLAVFNRQGFILETDGKLAVPVSVQQYIKYPTKAWVRLETPIQSDTILAEPAYLADRGSIFVSREQRPYYDFLKAIGYTNASITSGALLDRKDNLGLAPRRLCFNIPISASQYGFFIPVKHNVENFGLMVATGTKVGGINFINDDSYAPWTYGSHSGMIAAGSGILNKASNISQYVDFGSFNVAGYPVFNIGEELGANSVITSLSFQLSIEGFSTNYSLKNYNYAPIRLSRTIQDKNGFVRGINAVDNKEMVYIDQLAAEARKASSRDNDSGQPLSFDKEYMVSRA